MALSTLYIPLFTLEDCFLDKDSGQPLAAGVFRFYRDSQRVTPKEVYVISGTSPNYSFAPLGTELTLGLNGAFVDDDGNPIVVYAYPYDAAGNEDLYYITCESSGGVSQFTREAVPYIPTGNIPASQRSSTDNELTNPQFVEVNFNSAVGVTTTLSVTGSNTVTPIAPGWDLITSGTGTVQLTRLEPTAADIVTNPPYTLQILGSSGLGATIVLRQRLANTPSIFRSSTEISPNYASATILARIVSGGTSSISMAYAPSTGSATTLIASTSIPTDGDYHLIQDTVPIPDQSNSAASSGYVDINITLPTSRTIALSSIQLVGTPDDTNIPFDEQPVARQKDHLFHYYEDATVHQPKSSLLTGWNFALNPWQFRSPSASNVATNEYTADQTIIIQQAYVDSATGNNVQVGRASHTANYAYQITAVTSTNKTMVLQYIDPATIRPYWGKTVSARVRASITKTAPNVADVTFKCRLMYRAGLPATIAQTNPVSAWAAADNAIPTLTGWTFLPTDNDATYTLSGTMTDFDFNGFTLPASDNANMTLGIAFIMMSPMEESGTPDVINIEEISLVHNDFAISVQPETFDESLRKCQFHYEKSYAISVLPAANDANGIYNISIGGESDGSTTTVYPTRFTIDFMETKRATPSMTIYTPTGTVANISVGVVDQQNNVVSAAANKLLTQWTLTTSSPDRVTYYTNNATTTIYTVGSSHTNYEGFMQFHYVADSRLGT